MSNSLFIAWRYFWSKKNTKAINIVSWISVAAIAISVAAILVILSGFNGIEQFIKGRYSSFYPEIKIVDTAQRDFTISPRLQQVLKQFQNFEISNTLEQNALLEYEGSQCIVQLKGIDSQYHTISGIDQYVKYGSNLLHHVGNEQSLLLGLGVSNTLGTSEQSLLPTNVYVFKKEAKIGLDPNSIYNTAQFGVCGIFNLQEDLNQRYCFCNLQLLQGLADKANQINAIELKAKHKVDIDETIISLNKTLAPFGLKAMDRYSQNKTLYFVLKSEKWMIWAILSLIFVIACFNLLSTLSMLAIEKNRDFAVLKTLGFSNHQIGKTISLIGLINGMMGTVIGIVLSVLLYFLQVHFKLIKMGNSADVLLDAYPMQIRISDYVITTLIVSAILLLASFIPANKSKNRIIAEAIKTK